MSFSDTSSFYVSTRDATSRSANGSKYVINLGNTINVTKATTIVPVSMTIDNIFNNVNGYNNTFTFVSPSSALQTVQEDQYTNTTLAAALQALYTPISAALTMTINANSRFEFGACSGEIISAPLDHWRTLGFQDQVVLSGSEYRLTLPGSGTLAGATLPNLGGEKLINVAIDEMGPSNMIHSKDGIPHDVVAHISFHDVVFGATAHWRSQHQENDKIKLRGGNQLNNLVIEILDHDLRPLNMPSNYHCRIYFKVFHKDTVTRQMNP